MSWNHFETETIWNYVKQRRVNKRRRIFDAKKIRVFSCHGTFLRLKLFEHKTQKFVKMNLWNYLCSEVTRGYMLENDEVCLNYFEFCYIIQKNCVKQNSSVAQFYKTRHNEGLEFLIFLKRIPFAFRRDIFIVARRCTHSWKFQESWRNLWVMDSFIVSTHFYSCSRFYQLGSWQHWQS